jgi:hypothetical protein
MNISNSNPILKELDQVIIDLLIHSPFFGQLLAKSVKTNAWTIKKYDFKSLERFARKES